VAPYTCTTWQIQYTGDLDITYDVQMYDLDLFDTSATTIDQLHADGRRVFATSAREAGRTGDPTPACFRRVSSVTAWKVGQENAGWIFGRLM